MGTPHFAPSAKFQLILQVFPTEVCKGFASKCPGAQKTVYGPDTLIEFRASTLLFFLKKRGGFRIFHSFFLRGTRPVCDASTHQMQTLITEFERKVIATGLADSSEMLTRIRVIW